MGLTYYSPPDQRGACPASCSFEQDGIFEDRAISSAVEHFVDIEGVTGSIPVSPTMNRHYPLGYMAEPKQKAPFTRRDKGRRTMKVRNSLRSLKNRHRDCRVVRRKGRVYVINKTQRRFKARQG